VLLVKCRFPKSVGPACGGPLQYFCLWRPYLPFSGLVWGCDQAWAYDLAYTGKNWTYTAFIRYTVYGVYRTPYGICHIRVRTVRHTVYAVYAYGIRRIQYTVYAVYAYGIRGIQYTVYRIPYTVYFSRILSHILYLCGVCRFLSFCS
jgi:hypothetical protein